MLFPSFGSSKSFGSGVSRLQLWLQSPEIPLPCFGLSDLSTPGKPGTSRSFYGSFRAVSGSLCMVRSLFPPVAD
jgi:hypothetical protein